ncbi:MAG: hypothetical protein LQ338_001489 [Usnochroma carphineum]|nr:MAG: hypothetical protein LQ338_001489 [Usnochroma carphineum]
MYARQGGSSRRPCDSRQHAQSFTQPISDATKISTEATALGGEDILIPFRFPKSRFRRLCAEFRNDLEWAVNHVFLFHRPVGRTNFDLLHSIYTRPRIRVHTHLLFSSRVSSFQLANHQRPRTPKIYWSTLPHGLAGPLGYSSFGINFIERSEELVSDRAFFVTALEVMEDIYYNNPNRSEIVTSYTGHYRPRIPPPLNISAVGRGLEPGIPTTFTNAAMVRFVRWLGQISRAHRWETFGCYIGWVEHVSWSVSGFLSRISGN